MRFNNLPCRHAQCIFKTFKRFFNLFYFQIIIGLLSPPTAPNLHYCTRLCTLRTNPQVSPSYSIICK